MPIKGQTRPLRRPAGAEAPPPGRPANLAPDEHRGLPDRKSTTSVRVASRGGIHLLVAAQLCDPCRRQRDGRPQLLAHRLGLGQTESFSPGRACLGRQRP